MVIPLNWNLADLEVGGEEYYDRDLWERIIAGGKRKAVVSIKEESKQVTEDDMEVKPKKQRLMTEYLVDRQEEVMTSPVEVQPQATDDDQEEVRDLRDKIMEKKMVRRGSRPWRGP